MQVLVDSSVWIDYFTGVASPETDALDAMIGRSPLVVGDLILAEVLGGLPDERHRESAREALAKFWWVEMGGFDTAVKAAMNLHTLRARGIEARPVDCMIATFCIENAYELLASGPTFEPFARHLELHTPDLARWAR